MESLGGFVFDNMPSTFQSFIYRTFHKMAKQGKDVSLSKFILLWGCMNQLCIWGYSCNSLFPSYGFPALMEIAFSTEDK